MTDPDPQYCLEERWWLYLGSRNIRPGDSRRAWRPAAPSETGPNIIPSYLINRAGHAKIFLRCDKSTTILRHLWHVKWVPRTKTRISRQYLTVLTLDRGKFLAFLAAMLFQAYNVKHARIQGTLVLPVLSSIIPVVDIYNRQDSGKRKQYRKLPQCRLIIRHKHRRLTSVASPWIWDRPRIRPGKRRHWSRRGRQRWAGRWWRSRGARTDSRGDTGTARPAVAAQQSCASDGSARTGNMGRTW